MSGQRLLPIGLGAALLAFAAGPILLLVSRAALAPSLLWDELTTPAAVESTWCTLRVSGGAMGIALLLGAPLAWLFARTDLPWRRSFALAFTSLVALPPFILGMGWIQLANPTTGFLNRLAGGTWLDIYGEVGIAFVLGTSGLPLVLLATQTALARIDSSMEEAARMSGASPAKALLHATLPLAMPALVSGGLLVFLSSAAAFGVPYMLGISAATPTHVLTTRIFSQVLMGSSEHLTRACALAGALLVIATVVLGTSALIGRRGRVRLAAGKGVVVVRTPLGRYRRAAAIAVALLALVVVVLPLGAVVATSLLRNASVPFALENLTSAHWATTLGSPRTLSAAWRSLVLASCAGVLVCLLGLGLGLLRERRAGRALELLAVWPYAVPGTVLAMGLLVVYSQDLRVVVLERVALVLTLANSVTLLLLAYVAKYLAIGSRNVVDALAQHDPTLVEAARVSGAAPLRAFADVTLPALRGPLLAAFLLTFLLCVTELTMSVLLIPPGGEVLGTLLFELQSYADPAAASVLACAVVLIVLSAFAAMSMVRRERA